MVYESLDVCEGSTIVPLSTVELVGKTSEFEFLAKNVEVGVRDIESEWDLGVGHDGDGG